MCSLFSVFSLFFNLGKHVFLVMFDTCDVVYERLNSLLPLIALDNLFVLYFQTIWKVWNLAIYLVGVVVSAEKCHNLKSKIFVLLCFTPQSWERLCEYR